MAENCNECSIAWIRGSDYAEISAYNGSTLKNRTLKLKEENPEDVHCEWHTAFSDRHAEIRCDHTVEAF